MSTVAAPAPPRAPRGCGAAGPLSAEDALAAARALAPDPGAEEVALEHLAGRRLAESVVALSDLPPAATSAMDGWAVQAAGAAPGRLLRLVGESAAGHPATGGVGPGEACRISTGARLPAGADAVLRREDGHEAGGFLIPFLPVPPAADVRPAGDDLRAGEALLHPGTLLAPHEVAVVAAAGLTGASCRRRARVAVLTTGDELVPPGAPVPARSTIDVILPALTAQVAAAGGAVTASARARDEREDTTAAIAGLLAGRPDLLVTAGGVSAGTRDHVAAALEDLGTRWEARGVAMRPGHPVRLGRAGATAVLALPGNPAAAVVCFHLLGRALLGHEDWGARATLAEDVPRHPRATSFVRCAEGPEGLVPLGRQGSHQVTSLAGARVLAWIAPGDGAAPAGARVPASGMA
ncbi:MAG: molybdopterin molybdotransferase MoeA [Thermoleophilia bacterium]